MRIEGKCEGPRWMRQKYEQGRGGRTAHLGAHRLVRRVDPNGDVFIWCRNYSGYARTRLGPIVRESCELTTRDIKRTLSWKKKKILRKQRNGAVRPGQQQRAVLPGPLVGAEGNDVFLSVQLETCVCVHQTR